MTAHGLAAETPSSRTEGCRSNTAHLPAARAREEAAVMVAGVSASGGPVARQRANPGDRPADRPRSAARGVRAAEGELAPAGLTRRATLRRQVRRRACGFSASAPNSPPTSAIEYPAAARRRENVAAHAAHDGRRRHVRRRRRLHAAPPSTRAGSPSLEKMLYETNRCSREPTQASECRRAVLPRVCTETLEGRCAPAPEEGGLAQRWTPIRGEGDALRLDAGRAAHALGRLARAPRALRAFGMTGAQGEGSWAPVRATSDPERLGEIKSARASSARGRVWPALRRSG